MEVALAGTNNYKEVFRGTSNVTNGILGKFDPSGLANDTYNLRLTAFDVNGKGIQVDQDVAVASELKLGNFRLSFTDIAIPVAGVPITLTRTYDTLTANNQDDFGYGWRMEFRDTDLRTSLKRDTLYEELGYFHSVGFQDGDRVYITLPGGKREGFTFRAVQVGSKGDSGTANILNGVFGGKLWKPNFDADKGNTSKLTVPLNTFNFDLNGYGASGYGGGNVDALLIRNANGMLNNLMGQVYRPDEAVFGNRYNLTTKDGTVYEINATTGDLESVKDTNGNTLTYSDTEIVSSNGQKVVFERDNQGRIVSVTDPLGAKIKYEYDAKGDLVGVTDRDGNTTRYQYNSTQQHYLDKIIDPLGREAVKTEYDAQGRLSRVLDVNGHGTTLSYDSNNSTQTVLDSYGKPTTYVYDQRGNILQEIDANGGITNNVYDEDNNLLSETDADGVTISYTYDNRKNVTSIIDGQGNITRTTYGADNRVTSLVSPTDLTTTYTYDSRGNVLASVDTNGQKTTFTYNDSGRPLTQTSADGQVIQWKYDRYNNPIQMIDSRGNKVDSTFDATGQVKSATSQFIVNGQAYNLSTSFIYDKEGHTLNNTNSKGNSLSNVFNNLGQLVSQTDYLGNITTFKYNSKGLLIEEVMPDNTPNDLSDNPVIKMDYDIGDRKISETSATGLVTRYIYDDLGRLIETIIPDLTPNDWTDNPRLKTEYTQAGRVKAQTDIYGNREEYTYNNLGQKTQVKDVLGNITKYSYDQGGKVIALIDPRNRQTSFQYDSYGRVVTTTYFDNTKTLYTYDELSCLHSETNALGQTETYTYDKFGKVIALVNAKGEKTSFEYDQRGNVVKVTDALGRVTQQVFDEYARKIATVFADNSRISYTYDRLDRPTSETDENGHTVEYFYDNISQLIKLKEANGTETKYTYDSLGRLISTTDPNQHVTSYEYDLFDRTTSVILPLGQRNAMVYDKYGQMASTTDYNGDKITYGYDQYGRLTSKSFTNPALSQFTYGYDNVTSQITSMVDGHGATNYIYDSYDRLASVVNPDGKYAQYRYDVLGNLISLQTSASKTDYSYDVLNRLDMVKDGARLLADYDYDAVGNLVQTKLADGSAETRSYDVRDRVTNITTKNSVGYVFSGYTYTLDATGNRMKVVESNGRTVDYQYDVLNRLTSEQITDAVHGNQSFDYTYDAAGNRLTKNDSLLGVTNYIYDNNNRLTSTQLGIEITNFTYDLNGSMTSRSNGTQTVIYSWVNDGENRLVGVSDGTTTSQFIYDGMGDRVATITNGIRTNYLTAGSLPQVVLEYDANGLITADYTQGLSLIRKRDGSREGFYHPDALGSTRLITDNVGLILDRYSYDAFGVALNQINTFANSFQFAGEQRDGTNLDYLRARYYDASLGRFISKDPFGGTMTNAYSQHGYQYAHANPVRYTDPTGYFTMADVTATISMIGTLSAIGGSSFGFGYIAGAAARGEDVLPLFGEWAAGFAEGVSGGALTDLYEGATKTKIKPKHAMLYQAGNIAGIGVNLLTGLKAVSWATSKVGAWTWLAASHFIVDVYGGMRATGNLYNSLQDNGKWEKEDAWNLLAFIPFIGAALNVKSFFSFNKVASADNAVGAAAGKTGTKIGNCFVAGTEIQTIDGEKNIEDIQVGDWVLADDPNTPGEVEYKQVLDTFIRHTDKLVDLFVDGEVISTTGEHPFWTPDKGWVEAKDLVVGSLVMTEDGRIIDIDGVETRSGDFTVYNFKVDGFHTYFVSELGILVHNAPCDPDNIRKPSPALEGDPYHPDVVRDRVKPPYAANPAHNPRTLNPRKTPEPNDAVEVYDKAVRGGMGTWYGMNREGKFYQFFSDNAVGVHFSGIIPPQKVPNDILKQLKGNL